MRIVTVDCSSKEEALVECPWAAEVREVDDGNGGVAYMCFESIDDAAQWDGQS